MKAIFPNMSSKEKVRKDVADPESRHLFVAAQIRNGLPLQLRAMREDRGWTQAALAEKLGTTQNTVSRLENPKTSKPTITTLKRIAEAFDVALVVKFTPFSEFIDSVGEPPENLLLSQVTILKYRKPRRNRKKNLKLRLSQKPPPISPLKSGRLRISSGTMLFIPAMLGTCSRSAPSVTYMSSVFQGQSEHSTGLRGLSRFSLSTHLK